MSQLILFTQGVKDLDILKSSIKVPYALVDKKDIYKMVRPSAPPRRLAAPRNASDLLQHSTRMPKGLIPPRSVVNLIESPGFSSVNTLALLYEEGQLQIKLYKFLQTILPKHKNIKTIDLLTCNINADAGRQIKMMGKRLNVTIRYSIDLTGHAHSMGNWVLESHAISVKNTYFNETIDQWNQVLHNPWWDPEYTVASFADQGDAKPYNMYEWASHQLHEHLIEGYYIDPIVVGPAYSVSFDQYNDDVGNTAGGVHDVVIARDGRPAGPTYGGGPKDWDDDAKVAVRTSQSAGEEIKFPKYWDPMLEDEADAFHTSNPMGTEVTLNGSSLAFNDYNTAPAGSTYFPGLWWGWFGGSQITLNLPSPVHRSGNPILVQDTTTPDEAKSARLRLLQLEKIAMVVTRITNEIDAEAAAAADTQNADTQNAAACTLPIDPTNAFLFWETGEKNIKHYPNDEWEAIPGPLAAVSPETKGVSGYVRSQARARGYKGAAYLHGATLVGAGGSGDKSGKFQFSNSGLPIRPYLPLTYNIDNSPTAKPDSSGPSAMNYTGFTDKGAVDVHVQHSELFHNHSSSLVAGDPATAGGNYRLGERDNKGRPMESWWEERIFSHNITFFSDSILNHEIAARLDDAIPNTNSMGVLQTKHGWGDDTWAPGDLNNLQGGSEFHVHDDIHPTFAAWGFKGGVKDLYHPKGLNGQKGTESSQITDWHSHSLTYHSHAPDGDDVFVDTTIHGKSVDPQLLQNLNDAKAAQVVAVANAVLRQQNTEAYDSDVAEAVAAVAAAEKALEPFEHQHGGYYQYKSYYGQREKRTLANYIVWNCHFPRALSFYKVSKATAVGWPLIRQGILIGGGHFQHNDSDLAGPFVNTGVQSGTYNYYTDGRKRGGTVGPFNGIDVLTDIGEHKQPKVTKILGRARVDVGGIPTWPDDDVGTFENCTRLWKIHIPSWITEIGPYAFHNCWRELTGSSSYGIDNETLDSARLTGLAGIDTLGAHAFNGCTYLPNFITTSESLTEIPEYAFANCTNLSEVDCPGLQTIRNNAFENCTRLSALYTIDNTIERTLLTSITTIEDYAFRGCSALTTINVPNLTSLGACAFKDCDAFNEFIIPKSVSNIQAAQNAFEGVHASCKLVFIHKTWADIGGQLDGNGNVVAASEPPCLNGTPNGVITIHILTNEDPVSYKKEGGSWVKQAGSPNTDDITTDGYIF